MAGRELEPQEWTAGKIVAKKVGGTCEPQDVPGAPDETHDFDVVVDGRRLALEVTSAVDGAMAALRRHAFGRSHRAPSLSYDWWLGVPMNPAPRMRTLIPSVVTQLEVFERHGVAEARDRSLDRVPELRQAVDAMFKLGVDRATRLDPPDPGDTAVLLFSLHGGLGSDFGKLNDFIARCATANEKKLARADGDERHLFVWVYEDTAELTMATLPPPSEVPSLPETIDVVWAATPAGDPDAMWGTLWRLRRGGSWERVEH
jgi:hypothetical protein